MVAVAGSFELQGAVTVTAAKDNAAITKGNVVSVESNKWSVANTSATGALAVAISTETASATTVDLILSGIVYVVADGTIQPNDTVLVSASTAGQVQSAGATPFATGVLGIYLGHENEPDGTTIPTAAVDGDIIRVKIGGPF
jgi:hypothetical protein